MNNLSRFLHGDVVKPQVAADRFVIKRSGQEVAFDRSKIEKAITRAIHDTKTEHQPDLAKQLTDIVVLKIGDSIRTVEEIQDEVERVLMGFVPDVAKQYILYRDKKRETRNAIASILNVMPSKLDPVSKKNLTVNSAGVFAARYLLRNLETEDISETMPELWARVAKHIALVDVMYSDIIYSKKATFAREEIDLESIKQLYKWYVDEDINPHLNAVYLDHAHRLFDRLKAHMSITFDEFFYIMFTNLDSDTVRNDVAGYDLNLTELLDIRDALLTLFAERVKTYTEFLSSFRFLPNTPTLMNSGTDLGQLCACFTFDMQDSIPHIFKRIGDTAMVFQGAGGVGINFSDVRPLGDRVGNMPGAATGPMSFQSIIDFITEIIKQGGRRKGANMGILETWHPQIMEWVNMKTIPKVMENYNISVGVDAKFWQCFDAQRDYPLVNPRTQMPVSSIDPNTLFDSIATAAWKCAEPGVIYLDNVNRNNPFYRPNRMIKGPIRITNPCAEQAMYPDDSCTLGSINLAKYVKNERFDYDSFRQDVYLATQFLDNVIDMNKYPTVETEAEGIRMRRIGLGFMGLAHALYKMRIPYNSQKGFDFVEEISSLLTFHAGEKSVELAITRGAHEYWGIMKEVIDNDKLSHFSYTFDGYTENRLSDLFGKVYPDRRRDVAQMYEEMIAEHGIRNTWLTTVAPTGTISMAADTSNGIEPIYSLVSQKNTSIGRFFYVDKEFEAALRENGLYSDELLTKIENNHGSCRGIAEVPGWMQDVFVTAVDVHWLDHLFVVAKAQKGISNSISKTVNLPAYVTPEDFKLAYLLARFLGIKGLALYRDGSRDSQVMDVGSVKDIRENQHKNPYEKNLKGIGQKGSVKSSVIETTPSQVAMEYVNQILVPQMNQHVASMVSSMLTNNIVSMQKKREVNTDLKCTLCGAGMVKDGHCITCSECDNGYCA